MSVLYLYLLFLATACGATTPSATRPVSPDSVPVPEQSPQTLILWHAWPAADQYILAEVVDRYNQTHTQAQVIPQPVPVASLAREMKTATLAGRGPHLVLLQNHILGSMVQDGLLLPLDTLVTAQEYDRLLPVTIQGAQVPTPDGTTHLYGVPIVFNTLALYYNKATVTGVPPDIETLLSTAHSLFQRTEQPFWGLAYTLSLDKTIGYLGAFGGHIFDPQGNLVVGSDGRDGTERWLEWLLQLRQDRKILAVNDSIRVDNALQSHHAPITIDWATRLQDYQSLWGANLGIALLPRVGSTGQPPRPYVQSTVLSINARVVDRQEQQAALDFLHYLVSDEAQTMFLDAGKQPALSTLPLDQNNPTIAAARVFREQALQGQPMPNNPIINTLVRDELERMQVTVLRGLATPADAVTQAHVALRERLRLSLPSSQHPQHPGTVRPVVLSFPENLSEQSWEIFIRSRHLPVALPEKM